jgi:hypothetical protein
MVAASALGVWGCDSSSVVGGPVDAGTDLGHDLGVDTPAVDTGLDAPPLDVAQDTPPTDTPADAPEDTAEAAVDVAPADTGPASCTADTDCLDSPLGRVCDTASGRCVPCTAARDLCPAGQYCDAVALRCTAGCRDDNACSAGLDPDAGAPPADVDDGGAPAARRCDPMTRACVECVVDTHCAAGRLCVGNRCVAGCNPQQGCPTGQSCCTGACVDVSSSVAHCGACDARCTLSNGAPACTNGTCAVGACTAPYADCNGRVDDGCEADTSTSLAHCGRCGAACEARPNTSTACVTGRCERSCLPGFADCDGDPGNGCEVDTRTSTAHCGACNTRCTPPNGTPVCTAGACAIAACNAGFGDCDGNASNGCEVDLRGAASHCGMCGNACPSRPMAAALCADSACVLVCASGFQDCDSNAGNGCEVDIRTDATNCGACGRTCTVMGGTGRCSAGSCSVASCETGRADCDGNTSNGCEVDTTATVSHCGGCNIVCPSRANAASRCASGACGFVCNTGFGDCDGNTSNGCETDTRTSAAHCGGCGMACAARPNTVASCAAGACAYRCAEGFGDCDGNASNGCEVDLRTSLSHCGACGRGCSVSNGSPVCGAGVCRVAACNTDYADCDGSAANGCEVNLLTTTQHCGRCGAACGAGNSCYAGRCSTTCGAPAIPAPITGCRNVAPSAVASGSGVYAGQVPARANDGNRCTAWNSGGYAPAVYALDFGGVVPMRGVTLIPDMSPTTASVVHVIEVSDNGSAWRTALTVSQVMTGGQTYPLAFPATQSARYLRVRSTSSPSWIAWVEVAVYRCD